MPTTVFENNYLVEAKATNETKKKANHWKKCTVQGHPKHIVPSFSQLHFCKCSFSHSCITTNPQRSSALFQLARWVSQFAWSREKNSTDTPTSTTRSSSPLLPLPQASTKTQNLRNCVLQELLQTEVWESSTSPTVGNDNHSTKPFFVGYEKKVSTILATIVTRNSHRAKFRPKTNLKKQNICSEFTLSRITLSAQETPLTNFTLFTTRSK